VPQAKQVKKVAQNPNSGRTVQPTLVLSFYAS